MSVIWPGLAQGPHLILSGSSPRCRHPPMGDFPVGNRPGQRQWLIGVAALRSRTAPPHSPRLSYEDATETPPELAVRLAVASVICGTSGSWASRRGCYATGWERCAWSTVSARPPAAFRAAAAFRHGNFIAIRRPYEHEPAVLANARHARPDFELDHQVPGESSRLRGGHRYHRAFRIRAIRQLTLLTATGPGGPAGRRQPVHQAGYGLPSALTDQCAGHSIARVMHSGVHPGVRHRHREEPQGHPHVPPDRDPGTGPVRPLAGPGGLHRQVHQRGRYADGHRSPHRGTSARPAPRQRPGCGRYSLVPSADPVRFGVPLAAGIGGCPCRSVSCRLYASMPAENRYGPRIR